MKRFFLLTLFALTLMACGEGRVGLITDDVVTDAAGCYESVEVVDDAYLVSLDKTCVDFALSDFVIESQPVEQGTLPAVRDWELIATLERDIRQKHWDQFYVQEDLEPGILSAYTQGKDFLFVIEQSNMPAGVTSFIPIQFYYHQPEIPTGRNILFYPSSGWFTHWGPKQTFGGTPIDRSGAGLIVDFDPGFPGHAFQNAENRQKQWVSGSLEFRTTLEKWRLLTPTYSPHIADGYILKIYVR